MIKTFVLPLTSSGAPEAVTISYVKVSKLVTSVTNCIKRVETIERVAQVSTRQFAATPFIMAFTNNPELLFRDELTFLGALS